MAGEIERERIHIEIEIDDEIKQEYYRTNPESLLKMMKSLEFGMVDDEIPSPFRAGLVSSLLFVLGASPFLFSRDEPVLGLIAAVCATIVCLLVVGTIKTWATRGNMVAAALENLFIAGFGGGIACGIGNALERTL